MTIIEQLADFAATTSFDDLPNEVVAESKRVLLDSLGCALPGHAHPKGSIGVELGRVFGGASDEATILGSSQRSSVLGAAFANGELINALDFDAILPPGHVSPYVIPGALALAEQKGSTGTDLLIANAVAHEISWRFGKSMDWTRDTEEGEVAVSAVLGYTSPIFGATAAAGLIRGHSAGIIASALGIAGSITPVNSHRSWISHTPSSTIKYTMAGPVIQAALTAAFSAELGHRGDFQVLDDAEYGYRRFIGTKRWAPENLTADLGYRWGFPSENSYKPYPHCRVMHALFDTLIELLEDNDIKPDEIEALRAWGEGWVELPVWLNNNIEDLHDGQFSVRHGLSVAAQRIAPGPAWQSPDVVFSPSVLDLMDKVTFAPHPDYVSAITRHPASRPARIEIDARGTTFVGEREYPKGSPSPDPSSFTTNQELADKFLVNATGVLDDARAREAVEMILSLESVTDVNELTRLLVPTSMEADR
jgi:2-methylcitrate dehydratase PrpD